MFLESLLELRWDLRVPVMKLVWVFPKVVEFVFAGLILDVEVVLRPESLQPRPTPLLAQLDACGRGPPPVARQRVAREQGSNLAFVQVGRVGNVASLGHGLDNEALAPVLYGRGVIV